VVVVVVVVVVGVRVDVGVVVLGFGSEASQGWSLGFRVEGLEFRG
jgi:hypothetical protein